MAKTVLFLGPPDCPRCRAAEAAFNQVAGRMRLPWKAAAGSTDDPAAVARVSFENADGVEHWDVPPGAGSGPLIERHVAALVARLLGGKSEPDPPAPSPAKPDPPKKAHTVKLSRETAGRRGKGVTVVSDLPLDDAGLQELAAKLKQRCGTGGTAKDGRIEIQGDHRDHLTTVLEQLGYRVKRAGG